jgi:hypothetical protein
MNANKREWRDDGNDNGNGMKPRMNANEREYGNNGNGRKEG